MKKIILMSLFISAIMSISIAMAQSDLIPQVVTPVTKGPSKIALVKQLPSGDWKSIVAQVIQLILSITGSITFVSFTVGGVMMVTAQGDDTKINKGKGILTWSLIALAIIAASYGIVLGITQLKFFQ
jgi:hypothetical protein